jgi:peptidyl-tRNA hydrolase
MCLLACALVPAAAFSQSVPTPPPVANHVLTILTVKPGVQMGDLAKVMPDEVRETVRLYLNGKIEQWYAMTEGRGVVFILNCATAQEAQAMMESLPLGKAQYADFKFTPLGPLTPLRYLLGPATQDPTAAH